MPGNRSQHMLSTRVLAHLHIHFHSFLVERNVNQLHPKIMCRFVKSCVDAHRCKAAETKAGHENYFMTFSGRNKP